MKFKHELVARGFTNLSLIDSDSGRSGTWIEWESETYVGQKNGNWYKIVVLDEDNPYKGRAGAISVEEYQITPRQASQLGASMTASSEPAAKPDQADKSQAS